MAADDFTLAMPASFSFASFAKLPENGGFCFGTAITQLRLGRRVALDGLVLEIFEDELCIVDGPARRRWTITHSAVLADGWRLA